MAALFHLTASCVATPVSGPLGSRSASPVWDCGFQYLWWVDPRARTLHVGRPCVDDSLTFDRVASIPIDDPCNVSPTHNASPLMFVALTDDNFDSLRHGSRGHVYGTTLDGASLSPVLQPSSDTQTIQSNASSLLPLDTSTTTATVTINAKSKKHVLAQPTAFHHCSAHLRSRHVLVIGAYAGSLFENKAGLLCVEMPNSLPWIDALTPYHTLVSAAALRTTHITVLHPSCVFVGEKGRQRWASLEVGAGRVRPGGCLTLLASPTAAFCGDAACSVAPRAMAWSHDGAVLYMAYQRYITSTTCTVRNRTSDEKSDGNDRNDSDVSLGSAVVLWQLSGKICHDGASIEGICIDNAGAIWVALGAAGKVVRLSRATNGSMAVSGHISLPEAQLHATNCCFGGRDLSTLYITTASRESIDSKKCRSPIYAAKLVGIARGAADTPVLISKAHRNATIHIYICRENTASKL